MNKALKTILSRFGKFMGYCDYVDPYLKEMIPLLVLCRVTGRGPIKINNDGKMEIDFFSLHGLYFITSYGFLTYVTIDGYVTEIASYFTRDDFNSLYSSIVSMLVGALHFSSILSLATMWAPSLNYADEWAKLNVEYEKVMGTAHEYKCRWIVLISAMSLPCISVILVPSLLGSSHGTNWYKMLVPFSIFLSCTSEYLIIIFSCLELMIMATKIHFKLKCLVKSKRITAEKVHDLRKLWLRCSRVARITGMSNTFQFILDVAGSAMLYAVASFALLSSVVMRDFEVTDYFVSIMCCWFRLFVLFEVGELTTNFIGSHIRSTLSTLRIESLDIRVTDEIEIFILNIHNNYPNLNINGFTYVSRRVLFEIMAQANLNIIVLIQIRMTR